MSRPGVIAFFGMGPPSTFSNGTTMGPPYISVQVADKVEFKPPDIAILEDILTTVIKLRGCGNENKLPEEYIKKTIEYAYTHPLNSIAMIAVEFVEGQKDPNPKGYLIGFGKPNNLHLQIVCAASGWGPLLINSMIDFADAIKVNIELDALEGVMYYYQKYGFVFKNRCEDADIDIGNDRSQKDDALKHLVKHDINVYHGPDCNKRYNVRPGAPESEKSANPCFRDGFRMQRCIHPDLINHYYKHDIDVDINEIGNIPIRAARGVWERLKNRADHVVRESRARKQVQR